MRARPSRLVMTPPDPRLLVARQGLAQTSDSARLDIWSPLSIRKGPSAVQESTKRGHYRPFGNREYLLKPEIRMRAIAPRGGPVQHSLPACERDKPPATSGRSPRSCASA